jgi:hypothetical protein
MTPTSVSNFMRPDMETTAATVPVVKRRLLFGRLQVAVLAVVGLLGLPTFTPYIGAGVDSSWAIAVSLATNRRMAFGRSLIFSYGPLGFLATPGFVVPAMGVISVWARIGLALLLGWLIARSVLTVAPMWATAIITVASVWALGGAFALGGEAVLIPLVLLLGWLVDFLATTKTPMRPSLAVALGAVSGTSLLVKFDTGLWGLLILLGVLALHARSIRLGFAGFARRFGLAVTGFVGALLIWWGVLAQPIGALGPWLRGSIEVLLGYDRAMVANGGLWWELPAALMACGSAVILSWLLAPVGRRSYVCILMIAASWLFTKQSFIRHDNGHVVRIFALLAFCLLLLLGTRSRSVSATATPVQRSTPDSEGIESAALPATSAHKASSVSSFIEVVRSISMVIIVGCLAMVLHLTSYGRLRDVLPDTGMLPRAVGWLTNTKNVKLDGEGLLKDLQIGSELRKRLLQGSLHIEPSETSVVLGLPAAKWNPLPVPQSYSAYTPWLDRANANALASSSGPDQVLYESATVDQRVGRFESPSAMVSLICRYHSVYIDKRWTLFHRNKASLNETAINACDGPTFELKSLIGRFGQRLDLDIEGLDDYLIVGRFEGFEVTNPTRLQELATRPSQFWFRIGDQAPGRFVPATAGAPHILSMPACLRGKLGSFDSGSFTNFVVFDAPPKSSRATSKDRSQYRVRVEALPFRCPQPLDK